MIIRLVTNLIFSIIQTLIIYLIFILLNDLGVKNKLIQLFILLIISWPILFIYSLFLYKLIKNKIIGNLITYFVNSIPMVFPAFLLTGFIETVILNFKITTGFDYNYAIFSWCYLTILSFIDNYYILCQYLIKNKKMVSLINKTVSIGKEPIFNFINYRDKLNKEEYRYKLRTAFSTLLMIFSWLLIFFFGFLFFPMAIIVRNQNSIIFTTTFAILHLLSVFASIGTLDFIYISPLTNKFLLKEKIAA